MNFSDWISSWNFIRIDDISSWLVSLGVFIATLTVLRIIKAIISRKISNFANKTYKKFRELFDTRDEKLWQRIKRDVDLVLWNNM